jgi:tRNA threonylcarbamoyladenosine biosynthesis protein TsaB
MAFATPFSASPEVHDEYREDLQRFYELVLQASRLTMNVLAFDTCFSAVSVAVRASRGQQARVASAFDVMETGHAEALMPMVDRVMREAQLSFRKIDRIVVTNGPGTFTGVRTGVAAARGMALATGAKIVGMSSLWAIARSAVAELHPMGRPDPGCEALLVVMDARKGQVYAQVVDAYGTELTSPLLLNLDDATTLCSNSRLIVIGNRASAVVEASRRAGRKAELCLAFPPDAAPVRPDALSLLDAAGRSSIKPLLPLYFRPPDAKPQGDKSLPWSSR